MLNLTLSSSKFKQNLKRGVIPKLKSLDDKVQLYKYNSFSCKPNHIKQFKIHWLNMMVSIRCKWANAENVLMKRNIRKV